MKLRFGERFKAIDGKEFKSIIDDAAKDEWDMHSYGKIIIPYSLFTEDKLKKNKIKTAPAASKSCSGFFTDLSLREVRTQPAKMAVQMATHTHSIARQL